LGITNLKVTFFAAGVEEEAVVEAGVEDVPAQAGNSTAKMAKAITKIIERLLVISLLWNENSNPEDF